MRNCLRTEDFFYSVDVSLQFKHNNDPLTANIIISSDIKTPYKVVSCSCSSAQLRSDLTDFIKEFHSHIYDSL